MKNIIINQTAWQTRIAITRDGKLQNVHFSAPVTERLERMFFRGTISKVLPGIQTAFVDIGQSKAGFLHISEVDRELAIENISKMTQLDDEPVKPVVNYRNQPNIKDIFTEGEPVLVQVSKEPIYEKGAKLTTCFTLPGRFIVLMPVIPRIGISKKIGAREERQRLKEIVQKYLPEGMGAIIRTTSEGCTAKQLSKDIAYLVETWATIQQNYKTATTVSKIHEDLDLPLQVIRDYLDDDVESIVTDDKKSQSDIYKFIKIIAPEYSQKVTLYTGSQPIFEHFGLENQLSHMLEKRVTLKSGGSLIIESTEAMTVVDVNTGKFIGKSNLEETILKTNLEAAEEIVRQLRLRNIGGLIVIDFIDMANTANRHKLFTFFDKTLRERDKFQSVVLKISEFGLVQMTRKRSGKTLVQELTTSCTHCKGMGFVKSIQAQTYHILRQLAQEFKAKRCDGVVVVGVHPAVFDYLVSTEYNAILDLEKTCSCKIELEQVPSLRVDQYNLAKKLLS